MITKNDKNQWIQYGVLQGGIEDCRSDEYPSIFNLLTNPENLKWIKKYAFNELIGKNGFHAYIGICNVRMSILKSICFLKQCLNKPFQASGADIADIS
jgi:hypothetical protein